MMKTTLIAAAMLFGSAAWAQEAAPATGAELGSDTRQWLDLQKTPEAQAQASRPVPGEVAEQVYQRYVNSFKYPIPEQFKRESFKGGSQ